MPSYEFALHRTRGGIVALTGSGDDEQSAVADALGRPAAVDNRPGAILRDVRAAPHILGGRGGWLVLLDVPDGGRHIREEAWVGRGRQVHSGPCARQQGG